MLESGRAFRAQYHEEEEANSFILRFTLILKWGQKKKKGGENLLYSSESLVKDYRRLHCNDGCVWEENGVFII